MEIAILFALICLNGVFAMSEIALVTARKARLQKLIDEGDSGAAAAVKLGEDPTRFLSTIQIGITSIGVLNGIVGEAALAAPMALWLMSLGVPDGYASFAATGIVVLTITYFSIVVGELVPKRIGQSYPETFARLVARPINFLALATKPFVILLSASTRALLRLMGVKETKGTPVTEEEIHAMLVEGTSAGVIESHEEKGFSDWTTGKLARSWCRVPTSCAWTWTTRLRTTCAISKSRTMPAFRWCKAALKTSWA
jgi:putative hemolysin